MPIHIRNFYYKKLVETKKEEQSHVQKASNTSSRANGPNVRVRK